MRRSLFLFALLVLGWSQAALAVVEVHFYSKDLASTFPHAFVRLTGTDEATGEAIDTNFGFTPVSVTPSILVGPVPGMIHKADAAYVARSDRHFSLRLSPQQHRAVIAVVERWRSHPQPNYRLNSRNCVHFIADVAAALGLYAPEFKPLMKKPKSFLRKVTQDNLALIQSWESRLAAAPVAPAATAPPPNFP